MAIDSRSSAATRSANPVGLSLIQGSVALETPSRLWMERRDRDHTWAARLRNWTEEPKSSKDKEAKAGRKSKKKGQEDNELDTEAPRNLKEGPLLL